MLGTLAQLAQRIGGRVVGDGALAVARIASIDEATEDTLTFATDARYFESALRSRAAAVLVDEILVIAESNKPLILVPSARVALVALLETFRTSRPRGPFRHPSAVIDPTANVAESAYLGAHVYVGEHTLVAEGATIEAGAFVGNGTSIGSDAWLQPRSTVMEGCELGARVVLHPGCVIGSEGFGWAFVDGRLERIPQVGNVILADDVEVGANTCIDRAQTGSTRVGTGSKIDNLCQIGHNCRIGAHSAFAGQIGMAGSTTIGDHVQVGGQAGFRGHITVGSRVKIAGGSQIWGDIPDDAFVSGAPARDHREHLRFEVTLRKLPQLMQRVAKLEHERGGQSDA